MLLGLVSNEVFGHAPPFPTQFVRVNCKSTCTFGERNEHTIMSFRTIENSFFFTESRRNDALNLPGILPHSVCQSLYMNDELNFTVTRPARVEQRMAS